MRALFPEFDRHSIFLYFYPKDKAGIKKMHIL